MTTTQQAAALASLHDMTHTQAGACFARLAGILATDPRHPAELLHRAALAAAALTSPTGCPGRLIDAAEALASEAAARIPSAWRMATAAHH